MIKGLYTVPPGCAILHHVAKNLIQSADRDMQALRSAVILLPTRRAIRALEEELINHADVPTVLLPKIMAIGDIELPPEDEEIGRLPPRSINGLERIASLMPYVVKHGVGGERFESQWRMAQEIVKVIDLLQTEDLPIDAISALLKESDIAEQWQNHGAVFEVIADEWLTELVNHKRINAAAGRSLRINALIEHWRDSPPAAPVWLVGSTGSIPAVRNLMKEILALPLGAVLLPGVDMRMSDAAWTAINDAHPQAILKQTITNLNRDRRDVMIWPGCSEDSVIAKRQDWLSAALSPFPQSFTPDNIGDVSVMAINTAQEEAEVITEYCLSHFDERPDESLVIVTNDNALTSKLLPLLAAYRIDIDPSAGLKLQDTPFGHALGLFLCALRKDAFFMDIWALLKHDDFAPTWPNCERESVLADLEQNILRKALYRPESIDALLALFPKDCLQFFKEAREKVSGRKPLAAWAMLIADELPRHFSLRTASDVLAFEEAVACLDAMATLPLTHPLSYDEAVNPIRDQLRQIGLRLPYQTKRSVSILGTMEARLIDADTVIMAGLNEGKWPDMPQPSPFLSRGMRQKLNVPDSERHAALSGHDFQQAFLMKRVVLSYVLRDESAPALPARWLMRLRAVTPPEFWQDMIERGNIYIHRRQARHAPNVFAPTVPPAPISDRIPSPLYVTQLETWRNDPYSFWAKHICGLRKLDPIFVEISAADKGNLWHKIFKLFATDFDPAMVDAAAQNFFSDCVTKILDESHVPKAKRRIWRKRLEGAALPFIEFERTRRAYCAPAALEEKLSGAIGPYAIGAKADRIDKTFDDGFFMLIDYKTGEAPSGIDLQNGYACQLSALALIIKGDVSRLEYVSVKGGRDPFKTIQFPWTEELAQTTKKGIINWISLFAEKRQAFVSLVDMRAKSLSKSRDYLHLARHKEWGIGS